MDPLDDLMARCSLRDQRAFAELYRRTSGRLLAVAMRIVRRRDWAEEILQESFVSIWHHVPQYDRVRSAPMTWMTTIVRNRALDWVRRPQHETSDEGLEHVVENWADDAPGPLDRLRNDSYDVVLTDLMLPDGHGTDLLEALRDDPGLRGGGLTECLSYPIDRLLSGVRSLLGHNGPSIFLTRCITALTAARRSDASDSAACSAK